jgi:hypothetical protein
MSTPLKVALATFGLLVFVFTSIAIWVLYSIDSQIKKVEHHYLNATGTTIEVLPVYSHSEVGIVEGDLMIIEKGERGVDLKKTMSFKGICARITDESEVVWWVNLTDIGQLANGGWHDHPTFYEYQIRGESRGGGNDCRKVVSRS